MHYEGSGYAGFRQDVSITLTEKTVLSISTNFKAQRRQILKKLDLSALKPIKTSISPISLANIIIIQNIIRFFSCSYLLSFTVYISTQEVVFPCSS